MTLPFGARFFEGRPHVSPKLPTVLFVPFLKGKVPALRRHIEFVNELGFDAVAFDFPPIDILVKKGPFSNSGGFGLKKIFADQIECLLNMLEGPKIVFAFSNPCASAIEAIARRNAIDVSGLVCDMGPSGEFFRSSLNYFTIQEPVPLAPIRLFVSALGYLGWGSTVVNDLHRDLSSLPRGFALLSIRGWKDNLIPPHHIDAVFESHQQLDWRKLNLVEASHLAGLRDYPEDYKPSVKEFLFECASKTNRSK